MLFYTVICYAFFIDLSLTAQSFSAIVGPNGSGKSNVIDSLLFVFGFRASKMRQGKLSALIHNSATYPNLSSCSVEVHFQDVVDGPDGVTRPVPDSQLIVSRRAFRNNSSKYYINGRESSFQEVTTLLKGRGIDLDHKRFLILQGEVESIAQMKPKAEGDNDDGLLEYLEDIIGTSGYKALIEESDAKVESLNEECTEKAGRLKLVETEMDSLEDQREEIINFLKTENDISMKKNTLYQLHVSACDEKIGINKKMHQEESSKLEKEIKKVSSNTDEIDSLKKQVKSKNIELEKTKSIAAQLAKDLSKKEIEKVQLEEKKKHVDTKRKRLEKQIETSQYSRNEAQNWLNNAQEESEQLNSQLSSLEEKLQEEIRNYENIQEELKDKTKGFADKIEVIQQELGPWRAKITSKESELAVAQSKADIIREKNDHATQALKEARQKVDEIIQQGQAKEAELGRLKKEHHHVSSQIQLGIGECEDASQKLAKMKLKLVTLRQNVDSARESLQSFSSQNRVLASLVKLARSGRVQGFHGRLGGLGTIDQKYDVAISTACPSLENFVVDTVEAGQECVNYLRKNNLGRGKFILLDQLPRKDLSAIETPENVPRLFDLVRPTNPKFAPAFYSVLNDTLVAADVEQARRIAYGRRRFRVVTLDGVLVDTSGTMSGGGKASKGGMKSEAATEVSEEDLKKMEAERDEYEATFKVAENTFYMMESSLKELQVRKPNLELEISKIKMDIENLGSELQESQAQYKEINREIKTSRPDTGALEEAENLVAQKEAELKELQLHSKSLEDQIAALQEKILEAGGVELRMQRSKVDGIREQMDLLNSRISNGVIEKTKTENNLRKHDRAINNAQKEIDSGEGEMEKLGKALEELDLLLEQLQDESSKSSDACETCQEALEELRNTLEIKQKEIDETRSEEINLRNNIEQYEKEIDEQSNVKKHWEGLLSELYLHDVTSLAGKGKKNEKEQAAKETTVEGEDMYVDDEKPVAVKKENSEDIPTNLLYKYSHDELREFSGDEIKKSISVLEKNIENVRIDLQVLREYQKRLADYEERRSILNKSVESRDKLKKIVDDLRQKRLDDFMVGFNAISSKLKEMYQMITMGGNAELELVDSLNPFSEGILFSVMPPKKSWRNISNLSGGEKTLSSLALVFALHHYKPTPLYVMDEIDAALDFRNVSIVATYIKERTKNGQFIVISLRNNMFELAQQLVGIYKVNNMTKSVAIQNKDYIRRG